MTGAGNFTSDLSFVGMAHAAFVRSPEAHAEIVGIETARARSRAGVVAVFTGADFGSPLIPPPPPLTGASAMLRPVLAEEKVRFVGEPVAIVVAETPELAADTVEDVAIDLEPLPAVTDPRSAVRGDTLLFPDAGTNVALQQSVGSIGGSSGAPVRVRLQIESQRVDPMTMEPFAAVAVPEEDGTTTLWCGAGAPLAARDGIVGALGLGTDDLTIRVPDVGGAFGQRGGFRQEYVALVAAARRLERPVKWVAVRREMFITGEHGRDMVHEVELEADNDGVIRRGRFHILANLGAYPHRGWFIPRNAQQLAPGPYTIPEIEVTATGVVTNTAPTGPYRGAGRPEAALAIEPALDAVAQLTGIPPDEVRRRNYVKPDSMPLTTSTGLTHDGGDYAELGRRAREILEGLVIEHRSAADARTRIGVGYASFVETTAGRSERGEYARVEMTRDGVTVFTGSVSTGQGHQTVWPQIVADVLGVSENRITVVAGDTGRIPAGTGTFGSRSAALGGAAVSRAAEAVRAQLLDLAGDMLEADAADLEISRAGIGVKGVPGSTIALEAVVAEAIDRGEPPVAEDLFVWDYSTLASGCYGAAVAVDPETGSFELLELVAVDDCGVQINPMIVTGQVHGGIAQGLGQALFEHLVYADTGQPLTTTLIDYTIPDAPTLPRFTTAHMETPSPANPLGVRGVGEAGTIGAPPAVLAAVRAAIGDTGAPGLQLPLRPERIWRAGRPADDGRDE